MIGHPAIAYLVAQRILDERPRGSDQHTDGRKPSRRLAQ